MQRVAQLLFSGSGRRICERESLCWYARSQESARASWRRARSEPRPSPGCRRFITASLPLRRRAMLHRLRRVRPPRPRPPQPRHASPYYSSAPPLHAEFERHPAFLDLSSELDTAGLPAFAAHGESCVSVLHEPKDFYQSLLVRRCPLDVLLLVDAQLTLSPSLARRARSGRQSGASSSRASMSARRRPSWCAPASTCPPSTPLHR